MKGTSALIYFFETDIYGRHCFQHTTPTAYSSTDNHARLFGLNEYGNYYRLMEERLTLLVFALIYDLSLLTMGSISLSNSNTRFNKSVAAVRASSGVSLFLADRVVCTISPLEVP